MPHLASVPTISALMRPGRADTSRDERKVERCPFLEGESNMKGVVD